MPAEVGSVSLALVVEVCAVALIDMLDVAGTVGDGDQDSGRYWLHEPWVQQLASQRLNEISGPPWASLNVILAQTLLLLQWSPLKQSLTPINVPFINSIVAAKHLWQTKVSSAQHKSSHAQHEKAKRNALKPRQICVPASSIYVFFAIFSSQFLSRDGHFVITAHTFCNN